MYLRKTSHLVFAVGVQDKVWQGKENEKRNFLGPPSSVEGFIRGNGTTVDYGTPPCMQAATLAIQSPEGIRLEGLLLTDGTHS